MPEGSFQQDAQGRTFPLTYDVFAAAFGQKELERKSKKSGLATEEQCAALRMAFGPEEASPEEVINRSLSKYDVERVEDFVGGRTLTLILEKIEVRRFEAMPEIDAPNIGNADEFSPVPVGKYLCKPRFGRMTRQPPRTGRKNGIWMFVVVDGPFAGQARHPRQPIVRQRDRTEARV